MTRAEVVARLAGAGCVAPEEEADQLLGAGWTSDQLAAAVARREAGEPLAWITGTTWFCGLRLRVDRGVYVPRWHTEQLAIEAARRLPADGQAADLCTGTGAVAAHVTAVAPRARVVAVDRDPRAVRCARSNGVAAVVGEVGAPLAPAAFHVVTAVAPYVPTDSLPLLARDVRAYEPRTALDGGGDGLDVVRAVIADGARILRADGALLLELGGDQLEPATTALVAAGFDGIEPFTDDEGDLRGLAATLTSTNRKA